MDEGMAASARYHGTSRSLGFALLALIACARSTAETTAPSEPPAAEFSVDEKRERVENYLNGLVEQSRLRGRVLIRGPDFEMDWSSGPSLDVIPLGSLTKQFTAVAILQLVAEGALQLDGPIAPYLPHAGPVGDATFRQLLSHRSGLPPEIPDEFAPTRRDLYKVAEAAADASLRSEPGTEHLYSNFGYSLLAHVVEEVSGQPWCERLASALFQPAGMSNTSCCDRARKSVSVGHTLGPAGDLMPQPNPDFPALAGAGDVCGSAEDLINWTHVLSADSLLPAEFRTQMRTRQAADHPYGMGVFVSSFGDRKLIQHTGALPGLRTLYLHYPEDGVTIILLSDLAPVPLAEVEEVLSSIVFQSSYVAPSPISLTTEPMSPELDSRLSGNYHLAGDPSQTILIEATESSLVILDDGVRSELQKLEGEQVLLIVETKETISYTLPAEGPVRELVYHTVEGWNAPFVRLDSPSQ
ncbi:serine hydrolase domain-containing protein [Enhygromyxa salina]|uniref:serine hydrolase domain-containing protein n=1 Tax=Enhygromyxa salina TaxID=215803 RepID=UPI000699100C|nr:serine hydrolase domain-containing protein [Enhygromyxa salina]